MTILEIRGGPITHRHLMNKTKDELARMVLELLRMVEAGGRCAIAPAEKKADPSADLQSTEADFRSAKAEAPKES